MGKKCSRCSTRYCGPACQAQHWKEDGHDKLCKKIRKEGGAEQYNANKKHAEAVKAATEACAEDTNGQTCYICMEVVHPRTGEGLVRGCACGDRDGVAAGTTGIAHVSCLAEQAKILVAEAEENNLDARTLCSKWERWNMCSLCEQEYHGVVRCALGWACWKTYVRRPEGHMLKNNAMTELGNGLSEVGHHTDALIVMEADLAMRRSRGTPGNFLLIVQGNLANIYDLVGRHEEALEMYRNVYFKKLELYGEEHRSTVLSANNYADTLRSLGRFKETKSLLRRTIPMARRVLGEGNDLTIMMRNNYAKALCIDPAATLEDRREAVRALDETVSIARRVFGDSHPLAVQVGTSLRNSRAAFVAHEASK